VDEARFRDVQRHQPVPLSEGRSTDFASTVAIKTEPDFLIATAWPARPRRAPTARRTITSSSTCPSSSASSISTARGVGQDDAVRDVPAGVFSGAMRTTAWDQIKRSIPPEVLVFGDVPWDSYHPAHHRLHVRRNERSGARQLARGRLGAARATAATSSRRCSPTRSSMRGT
jgi:hypothetical protein